jgi:hypothetical protein
MKFAVRTEGGLEGFLLLRKKAAGWRYTFTETVLRRVDLQVRLSDTDLGGRTPTRLVFPLEPGQVVGYVILDSLRHAIQLPGVKSRFELVEAQ